MWVDKSLRLPLIKLSVLILYHTSLLLSRTNVRNVCLWLSERSESFFGCISTDAVAVLQMLPMRDADAEAMLPVLRLGAELQKQVVSVRG